MKKINIPERKWFPSEIEAQAIVSKGCVSNALLGEARKFRIASFRVKGLSYPESLAKVEGDA
jgi:hypothetical protein